MTGLLATMSAAMASNDILPHSDPLHSGGKHVAAGAYTWQIIALGHAAARQGRRLWAALNQPGAALGNADPEGAGVGQGKQYLCTPSAQAGPATDCTHTMMNPPITMGAKPAGSIQYYKLIKVLGKTTNFS